MVKKSQTASKQRMGIRFALIGTAMLWSLNGFAVEKTEPYWSGKRVEVRHVVNGGGATVTEGRVWAGTDANKVFVDWDGSYSNSRWTDGRVDVSWSGYASRFWDWQVGARETLRPDTQAALRLGLEGTLPYWIGTQALLLVDDQLHLGAEANFDIEVELTNRQRLIPMLKTTWSSSYGTDHAAGLTHAEYGVRWQYNTTPDLGFFADFRRKSAIGATRAMADRPDTDLMSFGVEVAF